jgi:hypothetical protein
MSISEEFDGGKMDQRDAVFDAALILKTSPFPQQTNSGGERFLVFSVA